MNPLSIRPETSQNLKTRAIDLIDRAKVYYDYRKSRLKEGQSANLICFIGGTSFDVYSVGSFGEFINVHSIVNGDAFFISAPVEAVAFATVVSNTPAPQREIGFHADMMKEAK